MPELQLDILEEILARSQVHDLIRWKSVCNSWKSLISSCCFVKSHLNYTSKKKANDNESGVARVGLLFDRPSYGGLVDHLIGSSNGLVCIFGLANKFFVVNPSTHEMKELRNLPQDIEHRLALNVSGFGYDSSIDDYKVVMGWHNECISNFSFIVLTLKSNVWRSVAGEVCCGYPMCTKGTLCNGAIHWIFSDRTDRKVIVSFDLSKEVIKEIPQPDQCDTFKENKYVHELGTIKDCLCIIPYQDRHLNKSEQMKIWVMKNYNVQESWERWLLPPRYDSKQ